MKARFSIWIASKTRWAHLEKDIDIDWIPRVGEFVKFENRSLGDYYAWKITEVTHREGCLTEVATELLDNVDRRGYSFDEEDEFDEYYQSYLNEGWECAHGIGPNNRRDT